MKIDNQEDTRKQDQSSINVLDIFSELMKIFKQSISLLQKLISQKLKNLAPNMLQYQITMIKQRLQIIYQRECGFQQDTNKYIFPRLICRLRQILETSQVECLYHQAYNPLKTHVKLALALIKRFQHEKNIGAFCKRLSSLIQKSYSIVMMTDFITKSPIKNGIKMIGVHLSQKKQNSQQKNHNELCLNRVLQIVNKKYILLQGMDIQYSSFRTTIFQTKNKKNELYVDCFQRNRPALLQSQQYAKRYMECMRKRDNSKRRKHLRQENRKIKTQNNYQESFDCYQQSSSLNKIQRPFQLSSNLIKNRVIYKKQNRKHNNSKEKAMIRSSILSSVVLTENCKYDNAKIKSSKKENVVKDPLQLKNIVMAGNYFDRSDSLKFLKHSKNSFYSKRVSAILYRAFDQTFSSHAKKQRISLKYRQ